MGELGEKRKYLVATAVGGTMECPGWTYYNKQVISAYSQDEAVEIYNKLNDCSYFYGKCLGEIIEEHGETYVKCKLNLK